MMGVPLAATQMDLTPGQRIFLDEAWKIVHQTKEGSAKSDMTEEYQRRRVRR